MKGKGVVGVKEGCLYLVLSKFLKKNHSSDNNLRNKSRNTRLLTENMLRELNCGIF